MSLDMQTHFVNSEDIKFVQSQIDHHAKTAAWHAKNNRDDKASRHTGLQARFTSLMQKIRFAKENPPAPNVEINEVGNRLGDLSDLPKELKDQLVSVNADEYEDQIIAVLKETYGGIANVDEIFVGLYRKYQITDKDREFLARKLYRMVKSKTIYSVPKKKGVYSVAPSEEKELKSPKHGLEVPKLIGKASVTPLVNTRTIS